MARIPYVDAETAPEELRPFFEEMRRSRGSIYNVFGAHGHSPPSVQIMVSMTQSMATESTLPQPPQELVTLRVAQLTGSDYHWGRHRHQARTAGIADAKVDALAAWLTADIDDPAERAALAVTDEATVNIEASPEAVAELRRHFTDRQVVELISLIGMYGMAARILRSLAIDQEEGDELLPREGAD